ncbi:MAG TPA: PAS domain S-box protein [Methanocellaceae archaeon]
MISLLLVDDENESRGAAAEFFSKDDKFDVDTACSANEAMEKLNVYSYDIVVSDFLMPGTNGLELWKWLRAIGDHTLFIVHADEGWEDLVSETLGDDDLQIYLRNGDNDRDMVRLQAIVEETVRRKSEKDASALLKLNYRRLLNSTQEGIVSIDTDGKIGYYNSRMAEMLGRMDEDIHGHMLVSYCNEQGSEAIAKCLKSHAENQSGQIETALVKIDGTHLNVKLSASPEYSDTSRYEGIMFLVTDLTAERQEAEAIIKEKDMILTEKQEIIKEKNEIASDLECLREIVFKSSNAVLVIDGSGTVAFVNPAAEKLFNAEHGQIDGERPGFPLILETPIMAGMIGEQQIIIEMHLGDIEWGGQPAYLVTIRDVTSHFIAESELKKVRDELYGKVEGRTAELIETSRTLLSEVGEKKQVLIAMNEASAGLKAYRDLLSLVCREIVHTNKIGVDNLGKLIEAFGFNKEMTRLLGTPLESFNESSKLAGEAIKYLRSQDPIVKPVDITDAIAQVKAQYPANDKRIAILVSASTPCLVEANELIEDALSGIVENARERSSPNKQIMVSIAMSRIAGDDKDYCRCTMEDNAEGIPEKDKASVFEFPQERTNKGLGLFLTKSIIEGFNGKLWVEDRTPGDYTKGCRFVILLPAI